MAINKKLIGSLLGGATILIASFGGLKINDTIAYNKKMTRYSKIPSQFWLSGLTSTGGEGVWYLPDYKDDEIWKYWYENKDTNDQTKRNGFVKEHTNWEAFRDYCYAKADEGYQECSDSRGWCMECARDNSWDFEQKRKK
ncbi:hypothetical protein A6V39_04645 [Candidatus Mycoplasma haematobovis]|uniref:Uncharacterized protein n=1 Tax=Candidatus Mycoplasma haematobovis TaxID=432608 RepID=A0A1A9QDS3_9MOLU|nr:hypothetical protein [Candidatus Mycoplasma haematobovis]OAL09839.1 hypothetical protein A6V39_04645 [Candidatus Mycoplasma haematobovis]